LIFYNHIFSIRTLPLIYWCLIVDM